MYLRVLLPAMFLLCVAAGAPSLRAQGARTTMTVGTPTADANGVQYYPVTSVYQGSQQQIIRVLEPTDPVPGKPRRLLYVLPVDVGVDTLSSTFSDGLEELRLLDVPNQFNLTLIAPSFNYEPWYGDNTLDPTRRMESFIIDDLVPFGDTFAQGSGVPQRLLLGFSKSGNGALALIFRHPSVFSQAAAWDSPAQLSDLNAASVTPPGTLPMNFGTQANYNLSVIPTLITANGQAFTGSNRLWISGDQATWTADMTQLHGQLTAASIPHTWVQGGVRAHSWNSGWLEGAVIDLDANATFTPPSGGTVPPVPTGGQPAGAWPSGASQTTLSLMTDQGATCRYATTAGVAYGSMTNTFASTGGTAHSTPVSGLVAGGSYSYYVRCQDSAGNTDSNDFVIAFSVTAGVGNGTGTSAFSGVEDPLSENGMWSTPGSWTSLKKNNGVYSTAISSAAMLVTPVVGPDQYAEITYDQDPGSSSWPGVMTRVQGAANGSGYLAIAFAGQVRLYRTDDSGTLNTVLLASANADVGATPRRLRLESQGSNHRVYFNDVLMLSYTDANNVYATGQPGIANSFSGGTTVRILSFTGGALADVPDTVPPVLSEGQPSGALPSGALPSGALPSGALPSGALPSGTNQTTLTLTTNENATCRYATTAGVAYGSMTNMFTSTGGTAHSTVVTGLLDGGSYSYYVRCQDSAGNADAGDFLIAFAVATAAGNGSSAASSFSGAEDPLSENGMWGTTGSWTSLKKNNGVYSTSVTSAARLVTPVVSADQYAEITWDQDPGSSSWPGVMTRVQGPANGSGYLAIACAGQVLLYRTNDNGTLSFSLLASANANVGAAPRRLRLESQATNHRVYFNGVLILSYTDSGNVYTTGQPGIAASFSGGTTVRILSFTGGTLPGMSDTTPPVLSGGQPTGTLASGTSQTTLSLTTNENATCRYATTAGVAYGSMTNAFTTTGGTAHSTLVTSLVDGGSYSYYVRCQDSTGNTDSNDFVIAFSVTAGNGTGTSFFSGVEDPLSESGMWGTTGSWTSLKKNNGAYSTAASSAARLITPAVSADQYAEITYDQDPGSSSWPGVMTRVQGASNGGGYLALAFAAQVRLYRTDDSGTLNFVLLASANVDVGAAPRQLRLESQGANHRVYFNGVLMLSYTDSNNVYPTGQPGIAASFSGGITVKILSFTGGALANVPDTVPPVLSGGQPAGALASGTNQTTLNLTTNESATCRYATTAGVAYGSMTNTFSTTGGTAHSTLVTGLVDGGSYSYYVRCQDTAGNADSNDLLIAFAVGTASGNGSSAASSFSGVEDPLSENGMWGTTGSWTSLKKNNGVYSTSVTSAARLVAPVVSADQYAEITWDQDPGSSSWPGVMTRVQGAANGSGYLAIVCAGQVRLYRTDDNGSLSFSLLGSANVDAGAAPRRLRLESQGENHRLYFNGALILSYTDSGNVYTTGQPGIAASFSGGTTVRILSFTGGTLPGMSDTTPPVLSGGQPTGTLASGTSQATLSLTTNENATCRYATTAGVAYGSMTNVFTTTGGTAHSTLVTGLVDGASYRYYVRCQDNAGNTDSTDFLIAFAVSTAAGNGTATSSFSGVEDPLSENGMWGTTGSWTSLKKNNGAYSTAASSAARLVTPAVSADQYAEITYDQDPGSSSWPGVMTRLQGPANGSGYLAIAFAGQVRLYRTDDSGTLNFVLLASANVDVGAAPRQLRLESQGANHRVYFNAVLMLSYTDSNNVYSAGQPGIAASFSGGTTVRILSFTGGALAGVPDTVPPVLSGGLPAGMLASGTSQTTLSLTTNESATCRYATTAGVAYGGSMTNVFGTTGGTAHSTVVTGLLDGSSYGYYVRCQDSAGNADAGDFLIAFAVNTAAGKGDSAASSFSGVEDPLSENGMWGTTGSWTSLKKNNGVYSTSVTSAARLVTPVVSADQYAEITWDQDPGSSSWPGVMTRVQGAANGSGYLAIVCGGQVLLYRTDASGTLNFSLLASASVDAGAAPRRLRLESQGANHRVYFNGVLMVSYTDSGNVYTTGQPGIAASFSGGTTVRILSFIGGVLPGN